MKAHVSLGRIFGVQVGLHFSWFIIALLVTLSLAGQFYATNPGWSGVVTWAAAISTGLLFFTALLAHELAHAMVAKARGVPVRGITLFALGGVAEAEKNAADAKTEFLVGIVGPVTSALIGLLCLGLAWAAGWEPVTSARSPLVAILVWLGLINVVLAAFNMMPGFPLDGGRVLRAAVWWMTGDVDRSTRIAAGFGQLIAFGLILIGLLSFFRGAGLGGLWLVFIGWFLLDAARASYAQVEMGEALRGIRVGDAMTRDRSLLDARLNIQTFVDDVMMRTGRRCFVVGEKGHITGIVTPHEIKKAERAMWPYITLEEVMLPIKELRTIAPDAPLAEALEVMGREDVNQLPVTRDGRLEGIVSRGNILRLLQNRAEIQI